MLLIGSQALLQQGFALGRVPLDTDYICTWEEFEAWQRENKGLLTECRPLSGNKWVARLKACGGDPKPQIFEFEIAWAGSTGSELLRLHEVMRDPDGDSEVATLQECLALKLSHRFLKNSPAFLKTMRDIQKLRAAGVGVPMYLRPWLKAREQETYTYSHPNLRQDKQGFFTDSVGYKYEHDDLHLAVAVPMAPAYLLYATEGEEVLSSKEKFFALPEAERLRGVYEEACVLALERSLIPYPGIKTPREAFLYALMKVCTSITSGWFREWAWENYDAVVSMYEYRASFTSPKWIEIDPTFPSMHYVTLFETALRDGRIREFQGATL